MSRLAASMVFSVVLSGATLSRGQTIIYVDDSAPGADNGTSWTNAYRDLQDGLGATQYGDEIHVGQGTYTPDGGSGDRLATFQLVNGVALRGGYAGYGAPDPDERNIDAYETILSGDLFGNDGPDFENNADNSHHVITASGTDETAIVEGFVVTAGNDDREWPDGRGGGLYGHHASFTARSCTVTGNRATHGAGMFNSEGIPVLRYCMFLGNDATGSGGGAYCFEHGDADFTECLFSSNSAEYGGGMAVHGSRPTVVGCSFMDNVASYCAGGLYNNGNSTLTNCAFERNSAGHLRPGEGVAGGMFSMGSPLLRECSFAENHAAYGAGLLTMYADSTPILIGCVFAANTATNTGGGMYNLRSAPTVVDCRFDGNSAVDAEHNHFSGYAGGIYNSDCNPTFVNCTFTGNWARSACGGMFNTESSPTVTNCCFSDNWAEWGGGMCNDSSSNPTVTNCTFSGNIADDGGGMYNGDTSSPMLSSCILWSNADMTGVCESAQIHGGTPSINHSCIHGWTGTLGGVGNIGDDPLFVPGPAGCYYLSQTEAGELADSPCVDGGSDSAVNLDLDTVTTRSDEITDTGIVDMGYHYPVTGEPLLMGDYDRSGQIDLADFAGFQNCFTAHAHTGISPCCRIFDFEPDTDVDFADYAIWQNSFSGPGVLRPTRQAGQRVYSSVCEDVTPFEFPGSGWRTG